MYLISMYAGALHMLCVSRRGFAAQAARLYAGLLEFGYFAASLVGAPASLQLACERHTPFTSSMSPCYEAMLFFEAEDRQLICTV